MYLRAGEHDDDIARDDRRVGEREANLRGVAVLVFERLELDDETADVG